MIKKTFPVLAVAISLMLTGCATGYSKSSFFFNTGYEETKISEDTYKIEFKGNAATGLQTTYEYAMRRSAELAFTKGYGYFVILDKKTLMVDSSFETAYGRQINICPDTILKVKFFKSAVPGAYQSGKVLTQLGG